ncbi:MAG: type I-MYXAN CRISPR-associated protein Cas5/Cmx5/DevS [Chloracidobacterium sp.]|nr:type I-MYXAN CRISPR-associated protein Cas5/Cmx5/DevS [Chloracidobacterium sp.]MDW8217965.1 type I-MYXAN CRISPR-associated protein Cas5/Cmx5/DevS [Acidobacteriota bacterium]
MLLSLVGERFRARHVGVCLALAFSHTYADGAPRRSPFPQVAKTLRKLSRYKYGVPSKQAGRGNAPDYIETLCDVTFLCWVDAEHEVNPPPNLEERLDEALTRPEAVTRYGVLSLGLSDDAVNDVSLVTDIAGQWHWLVPSDTGPIALPVWVDHVGSARTRRRRYTMEEQATTPPCCPPDSHWTAMEAPV